MNGFAIPRVRHVSEHAPLFPASWGNSLVPLTPGQCFSLSCSSRGGGLSNLQIDSAECRVCGENDYFVDEFFGPSARKFWKAGFSGNNPWASYATMFQLVRRQLGNCRVYGGLFYSLAKGCPLGKDEKKKGMRMLSDYYFLKS